MPISLVTGGAGFIGSHLVDALLARGQRVRVLDNFSSGTLTNLASSNSRLEIIQSDVTDTDAVTRATEGVEYVFHLATPSYASYSKNTSFDRWACATDTLNLLAAAHQAHVKRLVYSSCESVYASAVAKPLSESDPTLPLSPYAFAKLTGEHQCVAYSAMFGLETVRLRYFNVFGPRQVSSGVRPAAIFEILKAMLLGQNPVLVGDGRELQDFIYVDDVVHANLLAAEAPRLSGKVYNIAGGRPSTLNAVVTTINALLGTNLQAHYARDRSADCGSRLTDIARAEVELGFCPGTDLKQGLRRCIAYYKARPAELAITPRPELATTPRPESPFEGPHFSHGVSQSLSCSIDQAESSSAATPTCATAASEGPVPPACGPEPPFGDGL